MIATAAIGTVLVGSAACGEQAARPHFVRATADTSTSTSSTTPTTVAPAPSPNPPAERSMPPRSRPAAPRRGSGAGGDAFACIRAKESGGDYSANDGSYFGAYQFDHQTAASVGLTWGSASPAEQDAAAARLQAERGWQPWPVTSRMCGLR